MGAEGVTIAVDPAARGFAWARYVRGRLTACGSATVKDLPVLFQDIGAEWIIETPQNYGTFGVAHRDLDRLRETVRKIEAYAGSTGCSVQFTKPFSWKGNVPKGVHHRRVFVVLTEGEQGVAGPAEGPKYDHNVYDAVALGLWASGRVGRGGTRR